jgi:hemerythrin
MADELVRWSQQYALGLDEIDEQHRVLIVLINDIWKAIVKREDKTKLFELVGELEKYTIAHFAAEEAFMRVTDYPGFPQHKIEHQKFVDRVAKERQLAVEQGVLSLDLMYFLRDWLIDHILMSDKAYVENTKRAKAKEGGLLSRFFGRR